MLCRSVKWIKSLVKLCDKSYRPAKGEERGCNLGNVLLLPQVYGLEDVHISDAVILERLLESKTHISVNISQT